MNLSRDQLLHATERQLLIALGITRRYNTGWLKKAESTEYTSEQVALFERIGAERRKKLGKPKDHPDLFSQKPEKPYDNSAEREINDIYLANRAEFD